MTKSRNINQPKAVWTPEEIGILRARYPHDSMPQLMEALPGKRAGQIYSQAGKLGLAKTQKYLASPAACRLRRGDNAGKQYRFPPGHVPANKGVKGICYPGAVATQFKPGHRGGRALEVYKPIGTERISKDGYLERKVNDDMPLQRRWRAVHILLWEEANGPLPKGHALAFRDGNKQHIALDNLELLSRAELMLRNTVHNLPPEIVEVVQLRAALNHRINHRSKQK